MQLPGYAWLAIAIVPPLTTAGFVRTGWTHVPDLAVAMLAACVVVGFLGALVTIVAWAVFDRR